MQVVFAFAQTGTGVTGKVVDSKTQKTLQNVIATVQNTNLTQTTDVLGKFIFTDVAVGNQLLLIKSQGYKDQLFQIEIVAGKILDLGILLVDEDQTQEQQLSLITITENDLGDDNSGSESTSSLLQASRDAFQQAAAFNWGQARFRIRGLDNEYGTTMINGVVMNKIYDGRPQWSNWGGLNDATRNQEFTAGSGPSDYTFGGILGTQEINTRASIYRPGKRISFAGTNTNYNWRMMGTIASGMDKDGWAYVVSAGRRWAKEGYFDGTDYSANSLFASVEKKFSEKHSLNFTTIYAQNSRGKNSPNTEETNRLAGGEKYNAYWGYDAGRKRNSRDKDVEEPILMLSHYWKIGAKTNLNTNVAYQFGSIGNSRLDYSGVENPDPSYYKNMPSYYTSQYDGSNNYTGNSAVNVFQASISKFLKNKQIDWQGLRVANASGESKYVLYEDRTDDKVLTVNSIINSQLADNISFNGGVTFRKLNSENFQNLLDLLGGNYFVDIDTYGTNYTQQQSDLNFYDRRVGEGDKYGYHYNLFATTIDAFTQFKFTYKKVDFYLAESFTRTEYQREGLYKNGYYPTTSFGKSDKLNFENFGFKGGLTYKITGRNFLAFNGAYMTKAPSLRNTFPNARINNNIVTDLKSESVSSADASYILNAPKLKMRLTAYWSKIQNATETSFFFGDGVGEDDPNTNTDESNAFVAETVTGINKRNIGVEFGVEYPITSTLKATLTAGYGEFIYDSNPNVAVSIDYKATAANPNATRDFGPANLKNYKLPGTPQQAASFGLEYRDPKFWWIGANVNYLGNNYIDVAPITRTANFFRNPTDPYNLGLPFPEATETRARTLLKQEKFDSFTLLNVTGGKSWRIGKQTVGFFASINNVLDTTYKTGGFEQARDANFRQLNQDVSSGTPAFAPKYFYGYGRTYFVNLYINF
ncbi:MAG: carboxypeptidase-like regulatory domain-containing protein [Pedobacter sp.]|nr:carboxypeptidase-like regulatory domain-containing protein [Pedobacter sp.]